MRNSCHSIPASLIPRLVAFCLALTVPGFCWSQSIELDASQVLNAHADKVGIWVNTNKDRNDKSLVTALKGLNVKSIRYGWQCGIFDPDDLTSQQHSPQDSGFSGYLANPKTGRMWENFGPAGIAELMKNTGTVGFAVLGTDGINYIGQHDQKIAAMSKGQRIDFYSQKAKEWASWAKTNPFAYFEIGNENDLSGGTHTKTAISPWAPDEYARVARRFLTEIKRVNPEARCGINGGLLPPDQSVAWFDSIVAAEPTLATDLDFIVAHKYEMWLDYENWSAHHDWDFGRLPVEYRQSHAKHFSKLPVHVTEIGPWKNGENHPHYRALLATEMLGNVRMDAAVEHVQFWPTRWDNEDGALGVDNQLTPMGLGLAAYARFAQPNMFAVGYRGRVRYFAAVGEAGVTYWFVNHAESQTKISCRTKNLAVEDLTTNEVWSLASPGGMALGTDTVLQQLDRVQEIRSNGQMSFRVNLAPMSVTVVAFNK